MYLVDVIEVYGFLSCLVGQFLFYGLPYLFLRLHYGVDALGLYGECSVAVAKEAPVGLGASAVYDECHAVGLFISGRDNKPQPEP